MRFFVFLIIATASISLPWFVAPILFCVYAFFYEAPYEILFLGIILDAYLGVHAVHLFYALSAAIVFFVFEFLKPRLSFYRDSRSS